MEEHLKILLYDYAPNNKWIETRNGLIHYLEWLTKEKKRIEKGPERKAEIDNRGSASALHVNEVKGCTCMFCKKLYPIRK